MGMSQKKVKMNNSNNISDELKTTAPAVANLERNNPYTAPMGYFSSFAENVLLIVNEKNIVDSKSPYNVPSGYFENLPALITQKINAEKFAGSSEIVFELNEIAPLLNSISRKEVYDVPFDYFETLKVNKPSQKPEVIVVSMARNASKWFTYAAAACILLVLSSTSYLYVHTHTGNIERSPSIEQRLASLNDKDIINYLEDVQEVPGDYLPASDEQENEIHRLLRNTSDEEIQQFLDNENNSGEKNIKGI